MSVLKRVEELYLEVLRFIIIASASVLLVVAVVLASIAASNFGHPTDKDAQQTSVVNPAEVTNGVLTAKANAKPSKAPAQKEVGEETNSADPNQATYERIAKTIVNFVKKYGQNIESVSNEDVIKVTRSKTAMYHDAATAKEFANGLAASMEKTLSDQKILKLFEASASTVAPAPTPTPVVQTTESENVEQPAPVAPAPALLESPLGIVNETLSTYIRMFNETLQAHEQAKAQALAEEVERKANAMTQLYIAGGAFGAFLMLVFISIVVKIERNLRELAAAPNKQLEAVTSVI